MRRGMNWAVLAVASVAMSAVAQTVTSTGTAVNTVPVVTATTSTTTTLGNSPISVSGSNVGIGTIGPADSNTYGGSVLDVYGPLYARQSSSLYAAFGTSGGTTYIEAQGIGNNFQFYTGDTDRLSILNNGNVGIGTSTPLFTLDVIGGSNATQLHINDSSADTGVYLTSISGQGLVLGSDTAMNSSQLLVAKSTIANSIVMSDMKNGDMAFNADTGLTVGSTFSPTARMYITPSGSVGIGTTSPGAKLEVNGTAQIDGTLSVGGGGIVFPNNGGTQTVAWTGTVCGGDYAESVDVTGDRKKYEPGDVLVIDPSAPGKFLKSAEPYSTAVLGVYSTKPGTVGRRQTTPKSEDEVPMAMVGIVPTKVSAENGAIKPGDLLVSASIPGYAMKGTDRSKMLGAIIGKALGALDSGEGVIEVGVTLQ